MKNKNIDRRKKGTKKQKGKKRNITPKKSLERLLMEGVNITRAVGLVENCMELSELQKRYFLWVYNIRDFLEKNKIDFKKKSFFYENDTVFLVADRGAGIDIESEYAQRLLKNIWEESKEKLKYLRKIEVSNYKIQKVKKASSLSYPLKNVVLDRYNYLLKINKGDKIISFRCKTNREGLVEKENKSFKIFFHLWEFHQETKNDEVTKSGEIVSLENLKRVSGCLTVSATYQHIKRLNNRFKDNGVDIKIKGENGRYRLVINKC
jgi:hypothetical protein